MANVFQICQSKMERTTKNIKETTANSDCPPKADRNDQISEAWSLYVVVKIIKRPMLTSEMYVNTSIQSTPEDLLCLALIQK